MLLIFSIFLTRALSLSFSLSLSLPAAVHNFVMQIKLLMMFLVVCLFRGDGLEGKRREINLLAYCMRLLWCLTVLQGVFSSLLACANWPHYTPQSALCLRPASNLNSFSTKTAAKMISFFSVSVLRKFRLPEITLGYRHCARLHDCFVASTQEGVVV
jgi:hypothetical protein